MDDLDRRLDRQLEDAKTSLERVVDRIDVPDLGDPARQVSRRPFDRSYIALAAAAALVGVLVIGAFLVARRPANELVMTEPAATNPPSATVAPSIASNPTTRPSTAPTDSSSTEPDAGLVDDREPRPVTPLEPAPPLASFVEPDFGTSITRLTGSERGSVTAPASSSSQVFNADGTLLLLYRTGIDSPGHVVVDVATGDVVATPDLSAATDIEDIQWDPSDPDLLRYVDPDLAALVEIDVTAGEPLVVHRFDGCDSVDLGDASGAVAGRTAVITVVCRSAGEPEWIAFDTSVGEELARRPAIPTADGSPDAPLTMASGNGFVLVDDESIVVLDAELEPTGVSLDIRVSAVTLALDGAGRDVLVAVVFDDLDGDMIGTAVVVDLATGTQRVVVGESTGYPYPPTGTTISVAGGVDSTHVAIATSPDADEPGVLDDEVVLVDLADDTAYRLAHHRMTDADGFGNWATPFVAVSPDGRRVVFSSNFGGDTVDTYLVPVPDEGER